MIDKIPSGVKKVNRVLLFATPHNIRPRGQPIQLPSGSRFKTKMSLNPLYFLKNRPCNLLESLPQDTEKSGKTSFKKGLNRRRVWWELLDMTGM